jgi:methylmalonyl-CoA mutase
VTAASLFDGHDAAINIMRRILQSSGAEVIHLGHNRSVAEIVDAAIQEDAHAIALSSYQGGHVEYLKYMVDMLRDRKRPDMRVFAGGGGVIVPAEIRELEAYGVTRIYSPEDGQAMGLQGLIEDMLERCRYDPGEQAPTSLEPLAEHDTSALASLITALENDAVAESLLTQIRQQAGTRPVPVLGITGTGGSGKSSLTDEIIRRFRLDHADRLRIAIVAVDPTRRRTGGSLLGDRIRMNAINHSNIYMRSIATRDSVGEIPDVIGDVIAACKLCQFDLVIVETPGIGQGDAAIVPLVDASLYVMTPEFGAQSQLEKIDMLDFADVVGAADRGNAGLRHDCVAFQRRWHHRAVPGNPRQAGRTRAGHRRYAFTPGRDPQIHRAYRHRPLRPGALPGRDCHHGARLPRLQPPAGCDRTRTPAVDRGQAHAGREQAR